MYNVREIWPYSIEENLLQGDCSTVIHAELAHWRRYFHGSPWTEVFSFLENDVADAPEDVRIDLNGQGIYALVMRYATRPFEEAVLEAHKTHVDIQISLEGSEIIDGFPRGTLEEKTPYDPEKDVVFFHRFGPAPVRIDNLPGRFTVLFPEDAHMPQLCGAHGPAPVKKAVVKVPVVLLPAMEEY